MLNKKLLYIILIISIINLLALSSMIVFVGNVYTKYENNKDEISHIYNKVKDLSGKIEEISDDILSVKYYIRENIDSIYNKLCSSYIGTYICDGTKIIH